MRALRETTRVNTRAVPGNFVYRNPTIAALAEFICALTGSGGPEGDLDDDERRVSAMHALVEKYSTDFPVHVSRRGAPSGEVVLVTGTTGGLGASLLVALAGAPEVRRVYALNRKGATAVYERQRAVLDERGFDGQAVLSSPKVVLLEAKADEANLGLSAEVYEEVR